MTEVLLVWDDVKEIEEKVETDSYTQKQDVEDGWLSEVEIEKASPGAYLRYRSQSDRALKPLNFTAAHLDYQDQDA
jgi:hypothetical protein